MQEKDYRELDFISQSDLKLLDKDIRKFYKERILGQGEQDLIMSDHFLLGSLVDYMVLTPGLLKQTFYISADVTATPMVREIITIAWAKYCEVSSIDLIDTGHVTTIQEISGQLLETAREKEFGASNWKDQTIIDKLCEKGGDFFNDLVITYTTGKILVPADKFMLATKIKSQLLSDPFIKNSFVAKNSDEEIKNQVILTANLEGIDLKGMLDLTKFDHKSKTIYPKDIKTAKSIKDFWKSYRDYRYDIQGSFYTMLLKENYPDYQIAPFEFIVGSTATDEYPEVFIMSEEDLYGAEWGGATKSGGYLNGWRTILEDYKWHQNENRWEHKKNYYQNGKNTLKMFQ